MTSMLAPDTNLALMQAQPVDPIAAAKKVEKAKGGIDVEKAEEAAKEFEAVFVAEMMKPMFEGLKHDGPFGGGKGEEIFHGMLVQEYGKLLSQTGSVGIADNIKGAMIQMQQEANGMSPMDIAYANAAQDAADKNTTVDTNELTNGENDATGVE